MEQGIVDSELKIIRIQAASVTGIGLGIQIDQQAPLTDSAQLQFRGEFFNVFNRAQYGQPLSDLSASTFGQIVTTVNTGPVGTGTPRQMQFGLTLEF